LHEIDWKKTKTGSGGSWTETRWITFSVDGIETNSFPAPTPPPNQPLANSSTLFPSDATFVTRRYEVTLYWILDPSATSTIWRYTCGK